MSVIELKKIFKKVLTLTKVLCIIKHVAKITKEIKCMPKWRNWQTHRT